MLFAARFRSKYHPEEFNQRREQTKRSLQTRRNIFMRLLELNRFEPVSLDIACFAELVRLLDAGENWNLFLIGIYF